MQSLHKKRLKTDEAYRKHMEDLYEQFEDLMFNFLELASEVKRRKGGIVFEWLTNNKLWKEVSVEAMIRVFGLTKVNFNGCQFGLMTRKGKAICKPWTFATNIPCVVEMFSPLKCERDHEHGVCTGDELKRTESYTPEMLSLIHI